MKYLLEKNVVQVFSFFFFESMLNEIMNLWQTFVCSRGLSRWIPTAEELLFSPKTT